VKADSPPEFCLLACENFIGAYCSVTKYTLNETFYITIDNFLGGISIAKKIQLPVFKTKDEEFDILKQSKPNIQSEDPYNQEKKEWIFICGSDLLKQSFQDGYDSDERYVNERAESDSGIHAYLPFFCIIFLIRFLNMLMSKPIPIPPIHEKNSLPIPLIQKQISNTEVGIAKNNYK
jgi:hypothetical protein